MDKKEFDLLKKSDKSIDGNIDLLKTKHGKTEIHKIIVAIENDIGYELEMKIEFNPRSNSKVINVTCKNISGPICRLEADANQHYIEKTEKKSRNHKHSLQNENSPRKNLKDGVVEREELSGKTIEDIFKIFCKEASIQHKGKFNEPT